MSLDKVTITDQGLLNINRKIINDRKFSNSLITTIGDVSIDSNAASEFSHDNYLQKTELTFSNEPLTFIFEGEYVSSPTNTNETAFMLSGSRSFILQFVHDDYNEINYPQIVFPYGDTISFDYLNFIDETPFKIFIDLSSDNCEATILFNNERYQEKVTFLSPIDITNFDTLTIGNNVNDLNLFWEGSVNLKNFEIKQNNNIFYTPTTGYSLTFTKLVVNDGKYPLGPIPNSIAKHRYSYDIDQTTRSSNTLLITTTLDGNAKVVIREIGLYAVVKNGDYEEEFLFGYIQNLNIDKGSEVPYDLIITVDLALSVVNVVGFPDTNSFILNIIKPALLKNFVTARNVNTYVIENLERIIRMNSLQPIEPVGYCYNPETDEEVAVCTHPSQIQSIGYNTPQLVYRTQKAISEQEDCYSAVQTYSKLYKKLKEKKSTEVDYSSFSQGMDIKINKDGEASGFSIDNFIRPSATVQPDDWTFELSFKLMSSSNVNRCLVSMGSLMGNYPDYDPDNPDPGTPFTYTPFLSISVTPDNRFLVNGNTSGASTAIDLGKKYYLQIKYYFQEEMLQVFISEDGTNYEDNPVIALTDITMNNPINEIALGVLQSFIVQGPGEDIGYEVVISDPLINGTVYLMDCKLEQEDNEWIATEEVITNLAELLQYYHLPTRNLFSYKTYDICNESLYYIDFLDDKYVGNADLIDFSNNLSLCLKLDLTELKSWAATPEEDYKPCLLIAKENVLENKLLKLEISRVNETPDLEVPSYSFSIKFTIAASPEPIILNMPKMSSIDFGNFIAVPFLLTVIAGPSGAFLYKNNELVGTAYTDETTFPSYDNSYITNTLEGYVTGKYVKEIIVIKEAISSEQLYYITNLTDTNF